MDTLESLDLVGSTHKSRRVRSWYLYEQYKSLERNQLDAVEKLKRRSYQDKILQQELSERKARRKLYNSHDYWPTLHTDHSVRSEGATSNHTLCSHDLYDCLSDLNKEECLPKTCNNDESDYSQDDSYVDKLYQVEEFQSADDSHSYVNASDDNYSITCESNDTVVGDFKDSSFRNDKVEELEHNLDRLTDDIERLEKCTTLDDDNQHKENCLCSKKVESAVSVKQERVIGIRPNSAVAASDNNLFAMWSRLVTFATQIIQLSHGNCYHDYGSQFLTAVLACDVLRIGINKMCNILQPYVSPITFSTDSDSNKDYKSVKRKTLRKKYTKEHKKKIVLSSRESSKKFNSEKCWRQYSKYAPVRFTKKDGRISEPMRRIHKNPLNKRNSYIKTPTCSWPFTDHSCEDVCKFDCNRVLNPMLKLAEYLDNLSKEFNDSQFI